MKHETIKILIIVTAIILSITGIYFLNKEKNLINIQEALITNEILEFNKDIESISIQDKIFYKESDLNKIYKNYKDKETRSMVINNTKYIWIKDNIMILKDMEDIVDKNLGILEDLMSKGHSNIFIRYFMIDDENTKRYNIVKEEINILNTQRLFILTLEITILLILSLYMDRRYNIRSH